jgi:hypothetical protein
MRRQVLVLAIVPLAVVACLMLLTVVWLRHLYATELFENEQARSREHAALANIGRVADLAHQQLAAQRQLTSFEHDLNARLQSDNRDLRERHAKDLELLQAASTREHALAGQVAALRARANLGASSATAAAVLPGPLQGTAAPVPH